MPLKASPQKDRIILGLQNFGPDVAQGARTTNLDDFNKTLDVFQARGYHEIDTARMYSGGQQEAFTAQTGWKERGLKIITKVIYPFRPGDNSAEKVIESVETSLRELKTDYVDSLFLHLPDRSVPFFETLEAVDRLHKAGKFSILGLTNFSAYEVAEVVMTCKYNKWIRPTLYEGVYNCLTRNIENELFAACRRYGIDVIAYNPVAAGLLAGKIKTKDDIPAEGRFSTVAAALGSVYRGRYFRDCNFEAIKIIQAAADKANLTLIETALRWLVHHSRLNIKGGNDGIILGVASIDQLERNLDDVEKGPLPAEVVEAIEEAWALSKTKSIQYWQGELEYTYNTQASLFGPEAR